MIGEFKLKTGDLVEARKRLEKCKEIRESLVKTDDKNALFKRDPGDGLLPSGKSC